jgi:hypothetical protein
MNINQLKTELREFIKLSETITPGRWEAVSEGVAPVNSWLHVGCDPCDGAFIARARNISPTMAKMLLVAVEGLELCANHGQEPERGSARYDLNKILKLWEETK